jgi:hypothetical protein
MIILQAEAHFGSGICIIATTMVNPVQVLTKCTEDISSVVGSDVDNFVASNNENRKYTLGVVQEQQEEAGRRG